MTRSNPKSFENVPQEQQQQHQQQQQQEQQQHQLNCHLSQGRFRGLPLDVLAALSSLTCQRASLCLAFLWCEMKQRGDSSSSSNNSSNSNSKGEVAAPCSGSIKWITRVNNKNCQKAVSCGGDTWVGPMSHLQSPSVAAVAVAGVAAVPGIADVCVCEVSAHRIWNPRTLGNSWQSAVRAATKYCSRQSTPAAAATATATPNCYGSNISDPAATCCHRSCPWPCIWNVCVRNLLWVHGPWLSYLKLLVAIMEKATLRLSSS